MNPILQPLSFPEDLNPENSEERNSSTCVCLLCPDVFDLKTDGNDKLLAHLLIKHKLVIGDLKEIADFKGYPMIFQNLSPSASIYVSVLISTGT